MIDIAKVLILTGFVLIVGGLLVLALGKIPGLGRLPGDIFIKRENFTFYFPLATCILISIAISFLLFLFGRK